MTMYQKNMSQLYQ